MIIGGPGAGKTWLGRALAKRLSLPLESVDDYVWRPDGSIRLDAQIDAALTEIAGRPSWIIEGGNTRTYAIRLTRADTLIWLDPPRLLRLARVLGRRPSRRLFASTWSYDRVFGPRNHAAAASVGPQTAVHHLRSRRAVSRFLAYEARPG